jgi:hypothetical protein
MNKKQTAVEWLHEKLAKSELEDMQTNINLWFKQAKEMEKEQIIDAHGDEQSKLQDDGTWRVQTGEQYYNETYGGNK